MAAWLTAIALLALAAIELTPRGTCRLPAF